jgi:metal-responsive CopG/Arc/MetJ family transcriptional regulator
MKKKFGTTLDEDLLTALKVLAAKEGKPLSQLIEEALRRYLRRKQVGLVRRTQGALAAPPDLVRTILEEEAFYAAG